MADPRPLLPDHLHLLLGEVAAVGEDGPRSEEAGPLVDLGVMLTVRLQGFHPGALGQVLGQVGLDGEAERGGQTAQLLHQS